LAEENFYVRQKKQQHLRNVIKISKKTIGRIKVANRRVDEIIYPQVSDPNGSGP